MSAKTVILVLVAAVGYSGATIGMKIASQTWGLIAIAFLVVGFAAATLSEVVLMRGINLGVLYLVIIAVETLIILSYAISIGEGLTPRQMLGAGFVLAGLVVVSY